MLFVLHFVLLDHRQFLLEECKVPLILSLLTSQCLLFPPPLFLHLQLDTLSWLDVVDNPVVGREGHGVLEIQQHLQHPHLEEEHVHVGGVLHAEQLVRTDEPWFHVGTVGLAQYLFVGRIYFGIEFFQVSADQSMFVVEVQSILSGLLDQIVVVFFDGVVECVYSDGVFIESLVVFQDDECYSRLVHEVVIVSVLLTVTVVLGLGG